MNILLRNSKKYISRRVDWTYTEIEQGVGLWNDTFNIDYFSFRKLLRKYVVGVIKKQSPVEKIFVYLNWPEITKFEKYKNQIFCPMDDDDIFLIDESDYRVIESKLQSPECNGVITGISSGSLCVDGVFRYVINPDWHKINTNNLIYRNDVDVNCDIEKLPLFHTNSDIDSLHTLEMHHIPTSVHFIHPCSITSLLKCPDSSRIIEMVELFKTSHDTSNVDKKFLPHISNIIDIYDSLRW